MSCTSIGYLLLHFMVNADFSVTSKALTWHLRGLSSYSFSRVPIKESVLIRSTGIVSIGVLIYSSANASILHDRFYAAPDNVDHITGSVDARTIPKKLAVDGIVCIGSVRSNAALV
jgi:hypothetical protein